jgi:threonylcarbamoyladenosine tRNA methylthiotransferase MtaB
MTVRVYLETLGCKLNQAERDAWAYRFSQAGYVVVDRVQDADVCVFNTCAVTNAAAGKSRRRARTLKRLNPALRVVVTGCYASISDGEHTLQADLVVPNGSKADLLSLLEARLPEWGLPGPADAEAVAPAGGWPMRTRPLVKIQDGCDNACTYCIVHVLRGKQRSRPQSEILAEIAALAGEGYHEIVLTGVHVGSYGRDSGDSLAELVRAILAQTPAPGRLRLSSIEPWDITPDFFSLWQDPRLCRHLHLPLQSGCDATLRRMNRNYSSAEFADLLARARAAIPGLAVTTDLIVGFPGETEAEFAASAAFVERMGFARAHVFSYSARPGTPAASMPDQIPHQVRTARARQVKAIARQSGIAFRQQFVGQVLPVLWERRRVKGRWSGLTDNYIRVYVRSDVELARTCRRARLLGLEDGGMCGELLVHTEEMAENGRS